MRRRGRDSEIEEARRIRNRGQQFSADQANEIAVRHIQGLQHLTGVTFEPDLRPRDQRIIESTNLILDGLL
jgi:phosphoribosylaminoimidazole-succinocarboxamide synthase